VEVGFRFLVRHFSCAIISVYPWRNFSLILIISNSTTGTPLKGLYTVTFNSLALVEGNAYIGFIVLYLGLGGVIDSLRSGTFPGSTMGATVIPLQQSVSVYQYDSGTIKGGVVYN